MKNLVLLNLKNSKWLLVFTLVFTITACKKSEYAQLLETETAKGITHDSILLGMVFGQTKQDFFDKCWKLNNQKKISHGPSNKFVSYQIPQKTTHDKTLAMRLLFYGIFNENKIMTGMKMQFSHTAWSLWNKKLQSDQLFPRIKDTLKKWYPGNDFIKVPLKKKEGELLVKVDGNRRIVISPIDDKREIKVIIDDLRYTYKN